MVEPIDHVKPEWRNWLGLAVTAAIFTLVGERSDYLLIGSLASCALLLCLFHQAMDLLHGAYALLIGFAVDYFGVSQGYWHYPSPDVFGIPYWFGSMWPSVGILGRRFVAPLATWLDQQLVSGPVRINAARPSRPI